MGGNQTSLTYPDETVVNKTYDELGQLTKVVDAEKESYTYTYDDAGNVTKLTYPNGWVEDYTYDAEGNLLKTVDTDPFHNNKKATKYEYQYDAEGNLTSEYKRATTAHDNPTTTTYTYDALNRIASAHEQGIGVNSKRNYEYDSLGNLIRVEQDGCDEYLYNGTELDQYKQCGVIPNSIGTSYWEYTYDKRGNLTGSDKYTRTTEGMKWQNVANYVYDETNHMVQGKNEQGEYSLYTYNGLGVRVGRELIMQDNTHGYTDFHDLTPSVSTDIDKPEVVKESYVVDYTTATRETLTMHEEGGFDYRWVHGLDRLSVKITSEGTNWWGQNVKQDILKDYTHQDRMGSTTNMTDKFGRIVGRADYNEWGEITYKEALSITSAYRRIWPEANYTGHDWDDVLGMYYAKARFYDPAAKRFVSMDPVKGNVVDPMSLVSYIYCVDNPLKYIDPLGEVGEDNTPEMSKERNIQHVALNPNAQIPQSNNGDSQSLNSSWPLLPTSKDVSVDSIVNMLKSRENNMISIREFGEKYGGENAVKWNAKRREASVTIGYVTRKYKADGENVIINDDGKMVVRYSKIYDQWLKRPIENERREPFKGYAKYEGKYYEINVPLVDLGSNLASIPTGYYIYYQSDDFIGNASSAWAGIANIGKGAGYDGDTKYGTGNAVKTGIGDIFGMINDYGEGVRESQISFKFRFTLLKKQNDDTKRLITIEYDCPEQLYLKGDFRGSYYFCYISCYPIEYRCTHVGDSVCGINGYRFYLYLDLYNNFVARFKQCEHDELLSPDRKVANIDYGRINLDVGKVITSQASKLGIELPVK